MTKKEFKKLFHNKLIILDGGMGTLLQKLGLPSGVCPEEWAIQNTELLIKTQSQYREAGSHILYTFTFGANPIKLKEYGLSDQTFEINRLLALAARKAAGDDVWVAGDISSCGSLLWPFGEIEFEEAVESFKTQVKGLLAGGVDLFVIETMLDIQEARAALLAVKELCDLPVMVTMTYEGERTLMGSDPVSALVTLQSLGADAVGCNCSSGPAEMVSLIAQMKPYARVPLIAKPNAGKPRLEKGKTLFDMDAETFASYTTALVEAGVNGLGGCCGTTPAYIEKVAAVARDLKPVKVERKPYSLACSNRQTAAIHPSLPFTIIGERLNPTGKKALKEALLKGDMETVAELAREQVEAGAVLLDINAGVPGINEKETLVAMVNAVCNAVPAPILLDSSNAEALEAALRIYPGRAVINSISGETEKLEKLLPLAQKYGAMFVLLPVDDHGVPETAEERIAIIKKVYDRAKKLGFNKEDILVDGVVMTVASNAHGAKEALKVVAWCSGKFRANTTLGLSNVSFGLPGREAVNSAFVAMAMAKGLSTAILNPNNEQMVQTVRASDALMARDLNAVNYTSLYAGQKSGSAQPQKEKAVSKTLYEAILSGSRESAGELARLGLLSGRTAKELIDQELIPAIQKVGDFYEKKQYFLPQLIRGAEAMEKAMEVLTPELVRDSGDQPHQGTVVIATVKGDVHDIGKNIVAMLLKNYGFKVIDLGKDVDADSIIHAAKTNNADIIALSALMTTTMSQMPLVMDRMREAGLDIPMMVGGAVLDKKYAESFGAHFSNDAYGAVKLAKSLMNSK